MGRGRSHRHVRHLLDRAGQHADEGRGDAAQPGCCGDQRRGQGSPARAGRPDSQRRAGRKAAGEMLAGEASRLNAASTAASPARSPGSAGPAPAASIRARSRISGGAPGGIGHRSKIMSSSGSSHSPPGRPGKNPGISPYIASGPLIVLHPPAQPGQRAGAGHDARPLAPPPESCPRSAPHRRHPGRPPPAA